MGMGAALNPCVGYVYVMELVPRNRQTTVITLTQIGEGIPTLIGPLYFMYGSTDWKPLVIMGLVISVISNIMVFWTIESPRFLYSKGENREAIKALKQIAEFNGTDLDMYQTELLIERN